MQIGQQQSSGKHQIGGGHVKQNTEENKTKENRS